MRARTKEKGRGEAHASPPDSPRDGILCVARERHSRREREGEEKEEGRERREKKTPLVTEFISITRRVKASSI